MRVLLATSSDSSDRKTLAALRSLARRGDVDVWMGSDTWQSLVFKSRLCRSKIRYENPLRNPLQFQKDLLSSLKEHQIDVLLPMTDETTIPISRFASELSQCSKVVAPTPDILDRAHDKLELLEFAEGIGLKVPPTVCPRNRAEVEAAAEQISYPCVLKPRRGSGAVGVSYPRDSEELISHWAAHVDERGEDGIGFEFLIQKFVPGEIHDACLLMNRGEMRAAMTQKRLVMHPHTGGVGIHNQTTMDKELCCTAVALLEGLRWHGPAMVEFKKCSETGAYTLLEVNARFWGTLDLAIQAGTFRIWRAAWRWRETSLRRQSTRWVCSFAGRIPTDSSCPGALGGALAGPVASTPKHALRCVVVGSRTTPGAALMIYFTSDIGPFLGYLESAWASGMSNEIRIVTYEEALGLHELPLTRAIFTDHERLTPAQIELAAQLWDCYERRGVPCMNHPQRVLFRGDLLSRLHQVGINDFQAVSAGG